MRRLAFGAAVTVVACSGSPALESDPASWHPPKADAVHADPSGPLPEAGIPVDPACAETSRFDGALAASASGAFSHRSGQPCLESCHEPGGSARLAFAAAGTAFRAQLVKEPAKSGELHDVGGTTLQVDACGNFYAVRSALVAEPGSTQPYVQSPTFHRMDRVLSNQERPGSCNQAGCHDFSSRLRSGIYF